MGYKPTDRSQKLGALYADRAIDRAVYDALCAVFINGAFCARALTAVLRTFKEDRAHAFITSAFYGVLDKNVRLEKLIETLCDKPPQKNAAVVLKIGMYYANYADMPPYAAVNRAVELAKAVGGVYSGFVNAVLKRSVGAVPRFKNELEKFSYDHCTPEWLCRRLIADYSETRAAAILDAKVPDKTHIRPVKKRLDDDSFRSMASGLEMTDYGCYCDKAALRRFEPGSYAVQSLSSIRAVRQYVKGVAGGEALDLCAAPGGKSVYLYELGDFKITSCDIYPHKIDLMRGYAKKLGARINAALNDATKHNPDFVDRFDLVIADCPCSGTGTIGAKPDILLRRKQSDLAELNGTQKRILDISAAYSKVGGLLCYSTCSILKCENDDIKDAFLAAHDNYELVDTLSLFPDTDGCDGFYIARFRRTK